MADWESILKVQPFDRSANITQIQADVEAYEKKTMTPAIEDYLKTLDQTKLPEFNIAVSPKTYVSGMAGDTYTIGSTDLKALGNNADMVKNKLKELYQKAGYKVSTGMFGGKLKISIPKTLSADGSGTSQYGATTTSMSPNTKFTDPRRYQAIQDDKSWRGKLRRTGRKLNPITRRQDNTTRTALNPNVP